MPVPLPSALRYQRPGAFSMGASSASDLPTTIGRYEVIRLLGAGAMGRVALARDPVLDREVAVKLLRTDIAVAEDVREGLIVRMRHEARAAARVAHPNLVVLHDMGEDPHVGLFLVFEYVDGPTLKERIDRGPLKMPDVARMARELGQALRFAHDAGVLHRDVKPDNVILSATGAKLVDFGIARVPDSTLTHQGGLLGTPAYSAPETFRQGKFSPASDQFSLAATIYEAVYGERAFPGDDAVAVASRIAHDAPERRASKIGVAEAVDEILARGLAKQADDRFATVEVFGRSLSDALLGSAPFAPITTSNTAPGRTSQSLPPPKPRNFQVAVGVAVVLGVAGLVARAALHQPTPAPEAFATTDGSPSAPPTPAPAASPNRRGRPARSMASDTRPDLGAAPAGDAGPPGTSESASSADPMHSAATAASAAPSAVASASPGPDAGLPLDAGAPPASSADAGAHPAPSARARP